MATMRLRIENGKLVEVLDDGRYFEGFSEDGLEATGNGWTVRIIPATKRRSGKIICHCERLYSDGPAVCHREFRLQDGVLGLAGGNVYSRYAYFRTPEFTNFLRKFGIDSVKKEDPNQVFSIGGDGEIRVCSDGRVSAPDPQWWSDRKEVSNASWAIVTQVYNNGFGRVHTSVLYTEVRNVLSLEPVISQKKGL